MIAAAGLVMGGVSAQAADLGGNCCADLEERVAELEATTARKGNRKVSLQIYGQVSETIMWWNDGAESNVYVQENNNIKNTVGFQGSAKINSDWSAGFKLELQIRAYRSSAAHQAAFGQNNNVSIATYNTQSVALRHAYWYLQSATYGRVTVGRDVDAAVGTSSINLVNPDGFSGPGGPGFANSGFFLRRSGLTGNGGLSALTWGGPTNGFGYGRNGDGPLPFDYAQTGSQVKYTSPFFLGQSKSSGFQFSSSWGQDDFWAVALRYVEDFGTFRFAAGASYSDWRDIDRGSCANPGAGAFPSGGTIPQGNAGGNVAIAPSGAGNSSSNTSCNSIQASASLLHVPTGLYVSGGGAQLTDDNRQAAFNLVTNAGGAAGVGSNNPLARSVVDNNDGFWWVQAGWQAKLNPLGNTIFWGQYVETNWGAGVASLNPQQLAATDVLNSLGEAAMLAGSKTSTWSLGVSQYIDAAAMVLYAGFQNSSLEGTLMTANRNSTVQRAKANPVDDMQIFYTGATIKF